MTIPNKNCRSCGGSNFYLQRKEGEASHVGMYCANSNCRKWFKWVGAKELKTLNMPIYQAGENPVFREVAAGVHDGHVEDSLPSSFEGAPPYRSNDRNWVSNPPSRGHEQHHHEPTHMYPVSEESYYEHSQHEENTHMGYNQTSKIEEAVRELQENCPVCLSGEVQQLTDSVLQLHANNKEGVLGIYSKQTNNFLTGIKTNFCFHCGLQITK